MGSLWGAYDPVLDRPRPAPPAPIAYYRLMYFGEVDAAYRKAAEAAKVAVVGVAPEARRLAPRLQFFTDAPPTARQPIYHTPGPTFGFVRARRPRTVWLRTGLPPADLLHTVAHELGHVVDYAARPLTDDDWTNDPNPEREAAAAAFARRVLRQLAEGDT